MRRTEVVALGLLQGPAELLPVSSSGPRRRAAVAAGLGARAARRRAAQGGRGGAARGRRRRAAGRPAPRADGAADRRRRALAAARGGARVRGRALDRDAPRRPALARGRAGGGLGRARAGRPRAAGAPRGGRRARATGCCSGSRRRARSCPGVSRSGATLAAARALGFARPDAVRLSRGIGVPVLAGAAALKGLRLIQRRPDREELATLAAGAAAACVATLAALPLARTLESGRPLAPWAAYRCAARRRPARARESDAMNGAYAQSGVDTGAADRGVAALVGVLRTIDTGRALALRAALGPLRGGARGRAQPRDRGRHRRRRLEADRRRADRPLRHGRDRLRRDERQRHHLRRAPSRSRCSTTSRSSRSSPR